MTDKVETVAQGQRDADFEKGMNADIESILTTEPGSASRGPVVPPAAAPAPSSAGAVTEEGGGEQGREAPGGGEPAEPQEPAPVEPKRKVELEIPSDVFDTKPEESTPVVEEPPAEPVAEPEGDEPPEVATNPKARNAWTNIKKELKDAKTQVATLQKELAERASGADGEVEQLRQQLQEYEEKLGRLDFSQSRTFREAYVTPIKSAMMKAVGLLMRAGRSQADAEAFMSDLVRSSAKMEDLQALLSSEPVAIQGALVQTVMDIGDVIQRRNEALANWKTSRAASAEEEQRMMAAELEKYTAQNLRSAVDTLRSEGSWLFKTSDSDEQWNKQVAERVAAVKGILKTAKPADIIRYVADGVAARTYRQMFEAEHLRYLKLQNDAEKQLAVRPGLGAGGEETVRRPAEKRGAIDPNTYLEGMFKK